ncbi:hypothetical protein D0859_06479 [Hortaea werneckii]|nr:hypothetical protein D0859_06479 [Hortaea werneckii]
MGSAEAAGAAVDREPVDGEAEDAEGRVVERGHRRPRKNAILEGDGASRFWDDCAAETRDLLQKNNAKRRGDIVALPLHRLGTDSTTSMSAK